MTAGTRTAPSRQARKHQTRQALLQAALHQLETRPFATLSLREITREVGITPNAFYRHFAHLDDLGLVLVTESFGTLRQMIRAIRTAPTPYPHSDVIRGSMQILARHVREHRAHFRFIARERSGGPDRIRQAIEWEIQLFIRELAMDLARFPYVETWSAEDVQMIAALIVNVMILTVGALLNTPPDRPEAEQQVLRIAEKQLRLVTLGSPHWRSQP